MITQEQLEQWKALAAAATPGPWSVGPWGNGVKAGNEYVANCGADNYRADADFIATARAAVPALVLELEAANRRVAELERLRLEHTNSEVFDKLDALAGFWRIDIKPSDTGGANVVLLLRYGDIAAEFTGTLRDVIMQADAWFDGTEFTFAQGEQP